MNEVGSTTKVIFIIIIAFWAATGCEKDHQSTEKDRDTTEVSSEVEEVSQTSPDSIEEALSSRDTIRSLQHAFQSIGILSLPTRSRSMSGVSSDSTKWILRNPDGSSFAVIDWDGDQLRFPRDTIPLSTLANAGPTLRKYSFDPYSFDSPHGLIQFKVDSIGPDNYHVFINDEEDVRLIAKDQPGLILESWDEYIPGTFVVLDDRDDSTTFRAGPGASFQMIEPEPAKLDPDSCTHQIAAVEGAWVKIRCDSGYTLNPELQGQTVGWTLWHENGELLIDLRY